MALAKIYMSLPSSICVKSAHGASRGEQIPCKFTTAKNSAVCLTSLFAFFAYSTMSIYQYNTFKSGVDLAIYDQTVKGYANLDAPYLPIKAQLPFNALGDHFTPIVTLLAPVYRVFPDVRTLLISQAALLAINQ
jgi:uncharacterized membrane protein